ncbi:hypothetical protein, variant [Verruconis gallopava]|uniref:Uncharacterized protein n=1 Tax=Verruconis gallopava TaxID=253628 RepID=A0A0D1XI99_9PEZI|nr:uncharacterized protein PV09_06509 [Verruconis gallopava]XP_016211871.1 hypothetical protein, variant [Verruconis gallopava]KIW02001.1 hypothetical protein PV09_06509 [Verruconis gallopava]KIW02002.1 hypothetical protein, variant [Verruconis gallopava]
MPDRAPQMAQKDPWVPCGVLNHKGNAFRLRNKRHIRYPVFRKSFECNMFLSVSWKGLCLLTVFELLTKSYGINRYNTVALPGSIQGCPGILMTCHPQFSCRIPRRLQRCWIRHG